jgi:hypothetical protein
MCLLCGGLVCTVLSGYVAVCVHSAFDSHVTQQARNNSLMMTHTHVSKHVGAAE